MFGSASGKAVHDPFDEGPARGPGFALLSRVGHRGPRDCGFNPGASVGKVHVIEGDVGVIGRLPKLVDDLIHRHRNDEAVLDDGAEVVVDVDDAGDLLPARQPGSEDDVVAVTQDVAHAHRAMGHGLRELCEPARFRFRPGCELASDAHPQQLVAVSQLGDRDQQRRRLRPRNLNERPDEFFQALQGLVLLVERIPAAGVGDTQHGADVAQQAQRVMHRAPDLAEQVRFRRAPGTGWTLSGALLGLRAGSSPFGRHGLQTNEPYRLPSNASQLLEETQRTGFLHRQEEMQRIARRRLEPEVGIERTRPVIECMHKNRAHPDCVGNLNTSSDRVPQQLRPQAVALLVAVDRQPGQQNYRHWPGMLRRTLPGAA